MRVFAITAVLAAALLPNVVHATAQAPDRLVIDGETHALFTEPLGRYLVESGKYAALKRHMGAGCTAAWRGYVAEWRIQNNRLELVRIFVNPCSDNPKEVPLREIFPENERPIVALWFSGKLVVPLGRVIQYIHMGYESRYERYLVLSVEKGVVLNRQESEERSK